MQGDLVEQVARALAKCDHINTNNDARYAMSSYGIRAREAIAAVFGALRDLSEGMEDAGAQQVTYAILDGQDPSPASIWQAMLDAFTRENGLPTEPS